MPAPYDGVTIAMRLSSARPHEAEVRGMSVDAANEKIRTLLQESLKRKFPGATVTVETGGDHPEAQVTGASDLRLTQVIRSEAEKTALTIKWDFSPQGLGLKDRY